MSKTDDEQVAAILARGVARVRAMDAAGDPMDDVEQNGHAPCDQTASSDQQCKSQSEAKR